jgi:hypothetical protein
MGTRRYGPLASEPLNDRVPTEPAHRHRNGEDGIADARILVDRSGFIHEEDALQSSIEPSESIMMRAIAARSRTWLEVRCLKGRAPEYVSTGQSSNYRNRGTSMNRVLAMNLQSLESAIATWRP